VRTIASGLGKGCLGGLALALVFFAISGFVYLILTQIDVPPRTILLLTVASGPIGGTLGLTVVLLIRARTQAQVLPDIDREHSSAIRED
jgi:hypothetical protein